MTSLPSCIWNIAYIMAMVKKNYFSTHVTSSSCVISINSMLCYYLTLTLSSPQSTVVIPLSLVMVPLIHIKTRWRGLRYSSDVTQGLSQLGG